MTAADIPSSTPSTTAARDDSQHAELLQRLDAISLRSTTRSAPAATTRPSIEASLPSSEEAEDSQTSDEDEESQHRSHSAAVDTLHMHTPSRRTAEQTRTLPSSSDIMSEASMLARQFSNSSDDSMPSRRPSTPRSQTDPSLRTNGSGGCAEENSVGRLSFGRTVECHLALVFCCGFAEDLQTSPLWAGALK